MNKKKFTFQGIALAILFAAPIFLTGQVETFITKQGSTNTVSQCSGFLYDDGGNNAPYFDDGGTLTDVVTLCPSTPSGQVVRVEFQLFDVAPGDRLLAFDGANKNATPIVASIQGGGTGSSVADAPGGGTVEASCKNISGCLTFVFLRNGDRVKGAGFRASVSCKARTGNILDCSRINSFNGANSQFFTVADCASGKQRIKIPIPSYMDCGVTGTLKVSSNCQVGLPLTVSGTGEGFLEADFPVGNHTVTFTTASYSDKKCTANIRVIAPNLVCNDNVNVSLSNECIVTITPDLITEDNCQPTLLTRPADGALIPAFYYEVTLLNQQSVKILGQTLEGYPIVDFSESACGMNYEVKVVKKYIYDADCDGKLFNGTAIDDTPLTIQCSGKIVIRDKVPPIIVEGPTTVAIPCYDKKVNNKDFLVTLNNLDPNKKGLGGVIKLPLTNASITVSGKEQLIIIENCYQEITASAWEFVNADCSDSEQITDWQSNNYVASVFGYYRRTFYVKDRCGNEANKEQRVWVYQPEIVAAIPEFTVTCGVNIEPNALRSEWIAWVTAGRPTGDVRQQYGAYLPNFDPTYVDFPLYPLTNGSGDEVPLDVTGTDCGFAVDFVDSDSIFTCGGSYKLFRNWTVYDWCDGILQLTNVIPQVINVADKQKPNILTELTYQITGNAFQDCTSNVTFTKPQVTDDCAGIVKVSVRFGTQEKEFIGNTVTLERLPIGQNIAIDLIATDACNNKNIQSKTYTFKDAIPPTAICETKHTVALSFDCTATVKATVFDDGSFDNCGQVSFSIARLKNDGSIPEANAFQDQVTFTERDLSADCTSTVKVAFSVKDGVGNVNYCTSEVILQDKLPPFGENLTEEISCEAPVITEILALKSNVNIPARLTAFTNLLNTNSTIGKFKATDNCTATGQITVRVLDVNFNTLEATCKQGEVRYTYQLIDRCGNTSSIYSGKLQIKPKSDWNISLPADVEYFCENNASMPTPKSLQEIIVNNGCDAWGMEVETSRNDNVPGACYKIIHTYHFINWCTWNPNNTEIAQVERPDTLIPVNYEISLRYKDANMDGKNDINDGDEDADGIYIYDREGPFKIKDVDEAVNYDPYDVTNLLNDGDFVILEKAETPYQGTTTYNAKSQFTNTNQTYVSAQQYGNFQYQQIIKVNDINAPTINVQPYQAFCGGEQQTAANQTCTAKVEITFSVSDVCTATDQLQVSYQLKPFGGNATNDPFGNLLANGDGKFTITGRYPLGIDGKTAQHQIVVKVQDRCNNTKTIEIPFEVKDCKAPLVYCITGLSATMSAQGDVSLPITNFDKGSIDYCTPRTALKFSFADPRVHTDSTTRTFRCSKNELGAVPVILWVQDLAGNVAFCETFINIAPYSGTSCSAPPSGRIAGKIYTEDNRYLQSADVNLSGAANEIQTTQNNGTYQFQLVELGYDYTITPQLNTNPLNGVTTFDLLLLNKHILGVEKFNTPYKLIAADVNNSGSITTLDILLLRRLLLNFDQNFVNNTSWRFIPADYNFTQPETPWLEDFPEIMSINDFDQELKEVDFIAIKVGDVNSNATTSSSNPIEARTTTPPLEISLKSEILTKSEFQRISFDTDDLENLAGLQFTLQFDPTKLDFEDLETGLLNMEHFGFHQLETGRILVSWNEADATQKRGNRLFSLIFRVKSSIDWSQAVQLIEKPLVAEAYSVNNKVQPIALRVQNLPSAVFQLLQNEPNPFQEATNIRFRLQEDGWVELSVYDLDGRKLTQVQDYYPVGEHSIKLDEKILKHKTGVFYYTLKSGDYAATRKMIRLE